MQRIRTALAIIVVVGYFGFEASNLHRLGYRMEPLYIFDQFARADSAIEVCGEPGATERQRFSHNFVYVTGRAVEHTAEQPLVEGGPTPEQAIEMRLDERRQEVANLIAESGCNSAEVRSLVKFHEIRARLNLG